MVINDYQHGILLSHWLGIEIYDFTHIKILSFHLLIYTVQTMKEGGHQGFSKVV